MDTNKNRKEEPVSLIKCLCYELYKASWLRKHIPEKILLKTIRDYYEGLLEDGSEASDASYESYLNDVGFSGEMYVSFNEFLEHEYLAKGYIWLLLDGAPHLFQMYLKDIGAVDEQKMNNTAINNSSVSNPNHSPIAEDNSLDSLSFNWERFTEEHYADFLKKREDFLHESNDYIGAVYVGDIAIDLTAGWGEVGEGRERVFFDFYVANEDTGYGYKNDTIPYDHADGNEINVPSGMTYAEFKEKIEILFKEYIVFFDMTHGETYSLLEHAMRPLMIW